ncbi:MAG: 5'-nucleotidase [Pseudomonadales bacterium]|nr:5'-nucleotidase [Pseudomonadales bacterium]
MGKDQVAKKLVVATSSSALFNLSDGHNVYKQQGLKAYSEYQIAHENEPLMPGDAFNLVHKLLRLNDLLEGDDQVEVLLLSRNSADTGLRVFNSIAHHKLPISRAAFTGGAAPYRYMRPFGCHLFLSTNQADVREVLGQGMAAASILPSVQANTDSNTLNFAFDGDAVLFSDEAEQIYQAQGLDAFTENERLAANQPLIGGPFKPFLAALHNLQHGFGDHPSPIRTALVTARAAPTHERVVKTLRAWDIRLDESLFLGGLKKRDFLSAYGADIFFDDQAEHCQLASEVVATGHVLHGISNPILEKRDLDSSAK